MITSAMLRTLFSSFPYLVPYFNNVVIEGGRGWVKGEEGIELIVMEKLK